MKKLLLLFFSFYLGECYGQDLYFASNGKKVKEVLFTVDSTKSNTSTIFISYSGNTRVTVKVELIPTGTFVDSTNIIVFPDFEHTFTKDGTIGIPITIKKGFSYRQVENQNILILLQSTPKGAVKEENSILQVKFKKNKAEKIEEKEIKFDASEFQFTLLTGTNFSFFDKPKLTDFAGLLNVYVPNIIGKFGLSMGIANLNFTAANPGFTADDPNFINARYPPKNVFIDPKAGLVAGAKYEQITYTRQRTETLTSWSYFLQPTYQLLENERYNLSLIGHFEFLSQTSVSTVSGKNADIDTLTVVLPRDQSLVFRSDRNPEPDRTITLPFANGYFGAGILWNIREKDKFNLSLNVVGGRTTDNFVARQQQFFNALALPRLNAVLVDKSSKTFYFVRVVFTEKYTKLNGTLGFDLRGNGAYTPQVAAYLGVKIDLDKYFSK